MEVSTSMCFVIVNALFLVNFVPILMALNNNNNNKK